MTEPPGPSVSGRPSPSARTPRAHLHIVPWERAGIALMVALFAAELVTILVGGTFLQPDLDRVWYMNAAQRFLTYGTPYGGADVAFLHPPIALYLFVPFTFMPVWLWYVAPLSILSWAIWSWKPDHRGWLVVAMCLAWPRTPSALANGNTDLWIAAIVALGLRFHWPAVWVLIKPTLGPFALIGLRHRSWWAGLAIVAVAAIPFGTLWESWVEAARTAPGDGPLYSVFSIPLVAMPVAAWLGRTRR